MTISLSSNIARLGVDEIYGFEVRERGGDLVETVQGQDPIGWLDDTHVLAYSGLGDSFGETGYSTNAQASIIGIDGSAAVPVDIPFRQGPNPNGRGAVAIPRLLGYSAPLIPEYSFVVWSAGSVSAVHAGYPDKWSPDGTKLAVNHPFEPTRGPDGWLQVVSWPGLQTLYEDLPHQQGGGMLFDPTSQFGVTDRAVNPADVYPAMNLRITYFDGRAPVDLPPVPPQTPTGIYWADGLLHEFYDGTTHSWDSAGRPVETPPGPAQYGEASADGSTVIWYDYDGTGGPITDFYVVRGGSTSHLSVPSGLTNFPGVLAPDGSAMALFGNGSVWLIGF